MALWRTKTLREDDLKKEADLQKIEVPATPLKALLEKNVKAAEEPKLTLKKIAVKFDGTGDGNVGNLQSNSNSIANPNNVPYNDVRETITETNPVSDRPLRDALTKRVLGYIPPGISLPPGVLPPPQPGTRTPIFPPGGRWGRRGN